VVCEQFYSVEFDGATKRASNLLDWLVTRNMVDVFIFVFERLPAFLTLELHQVEELFE
jgi:hypothetical protein